MAAAKKNQNESTQIITIKQPQIIKTNITIVGDTPLIIHLRAVGGFR